MTDDSLDFFLAACGSSDPLRVGVGQRDELMSETRTFRQPFLVVGRRPDSDLMLDHWQVSRRHAYLQLIEGRFYCVDLGSRTGTHGGDSSERSGWLERGRALQIGPFAVRPESPTTAPRSSGRALAVTWELPGRAIGQAIWRMDRHLALIGRSPACKIRIVETDVSKIHCSVVLTPHGVWAVDLLGQNGIHINDQPTRAGRIEDGDELRIGRHVLRARYDSPPAPLPPALRRPETESSGALAKFQPTPLAPLVLPGDAGRSNPLAQSAGPIDPSVNLLVHQFGLMQQQMFDQFHQTMMMMFEGFAALHREQAGSIREEFDKVRQLSEEIEALRVETARLADAASKPAPAPRSPINGHASPGGLAPRPALGESVLPPIRRPTMPEPDPGVDIHSQLLLRLSTIQSERQNRWQKILGMMSNRT